MYHIHHQHPIDRYYSEVINLFKIMTSHISSYICSRDKYKHIAKCNRLFKHWPVSKHWPVPTESITDHTYLQFITIFCKNLTEADQSHKQHQLSIFLLIYMKIQFNQRKIVSKGHVKHNYNQDLSLFAPNNLQITYRYTYWLHKNISWL